MAGLDTGFAPYPIDNVPPAGPTVFARALRAAMAKNPPPTAKPKPARDSALARAAADAGPTMIAPTTAPTDPTNPLGDPAGMRRNAYDLFQKWQALTKQQEQALSQPAPAPPTYQAPPPPQRNRAQDIGTLIAAAIPGLGGAAARQAQDIDTQREADYQRDVAAAKTKFGAEMQGADLGEKQRATNLLRFQQLSADYEKEVNAELTAAEHAEHDRATEAAVEAKLADHAKDREANIARFQDQFALGFERLGFQSSKWADQRSIEIAKNASNDVYRMKALGVRADVAYRIAQLRGADQLALEGVRQGGLTDRANASNATRVQIAQDHDFVRTATSMQAQIGQWMRALQSGDTKVRTAAMAQLNAAVDDPNSPMHRFMEDMQRRGLYGQSVADGLEAEIRAGMPGYGQGVAPVQQTFNISPSSSSSATPATPTAPAGAPGGTPAATAAPPMPTASPTPAAPHVEARKPPSQAEVMGEAERWAKAYVAQHPHATKAEINAEGKKHIAQWVQDRTGPPR